MLRPLALAIALASGILAGAPALASSTAPAVTVHYGDLDPGSVRGARALEARILGALRQVCDFDPQERQLALRKAATRCMAQTRAQLDLPRTLATRIAAR